MAADQAKGTAATPVAPTRLAFAVESSENPKTGRVSATYAAQASCPAACPLQGHGCYAESGPVGIHTRKLNRAAATVHATPNEIAMVEAAAITGLTGTRDLRLHVVGDCTTNEAAALVASAAAMVTQRPNVPWVYTHAHRTVDPRAWDGVSALASVETAEQGIAALDHGWAPALVVDSFKDDKLYTLDKLKVLPCPNQTHDGVTCTSCRLCLNAVRLANKGIAIGFAAHGSRTNTVKAVIAAAHSTDTT